MLPSAILDEGATAALGEPTATLLSKIMRRRGDELKEISATLGLQRRLADGPLPSTLLERAAAPLESSARLVQLAEA
jgi:hypothetical protein